LGASNTFKFTVEGVLVNVGAEDVADEEFEGFARQLTEQGLIPDGIAEEFGDALGFHDSQGHDAGRGAPDGIKGQGGELNDAKGEVGKEGQKVGSVVRRQIQQTGEPDGDGPDFGILGEDDRQDNREGLGRGGGLELVFPNADHVAQQAKGKVGVRGGLVLEEQENQASAALERGAEEQVAFGMAVVGIDEGTRFQPELVPANEQREVLRDFMTEETCSVDRVTETRLEELIMRLVNRLVGHAGGHGGRLGIKGRETGIRGRFFVLGGSFLVFGSWCLFPGALCLVGYFGAEEVGNEGSDFRVGGGSEVENHERRTRNKEP